LDGGIGVADWARTMSVYHLHLRLLSISLWYASCSGDWRDSDFSDILLEGVVGKRQEDLKKTPEGRKLLENLKSYYYWSPEKGFTYEIIKRRPGRGGPDPTVPALKVDQRTGIIIPGGTSNQRSGPDLSAVYAKEHKFNPAVSGVFGNQPGIAAKLIRGVQFHHITPWSIWGTNKLTQEMQRRIDKGEAVLGRDNAKNLVATFKSDKIKQQYMAEIKKDPATASTVRQLQSNGYFLTDVFHNGSHPGWNRFVDRIFKKEADRLEEKYKNLSNVPPEELNRSYETIVNKLRAKLNAINEKVKNKKKLTKDEQDLIDDKCENGVRLADNKLSPQQVQEIASKRHNTDTRYQELLASAKELKNSIISEYKKPSEQLVAAAPNPIKQSRGFEHV
jgi:hypothetical protein